MKKRMFFLIAAFHFKATAAVFIQPQHVDLYGLKPAQAKQVLAAYSRQIAALETRYLRVAMDDRQDQVSADLQAIYLEREQLKAKIRQKYQFPYVEFHSIFYPLEQSYYTTVDVIAATERNRLRFVNGLSPTDKNKNPEDAVQKMMEFTRLAENRLIHSKPLGKYPACPVFHCIAPFDGPIFKPYLKVFNKAANSEKSKILKVLRSDKNPERRAAAALLLAHLNNPKEIVQLLSSCLKDSSSLVRNNLLRVIGETLKKSKYSEFDLNPYLPFLQSPEVTDRNKALLILMAALPSAKARQELLTKSGTTLLKLFALKQPNNHLPAYAILKRLAGKDYGSVNPAGWERWLAKSQKHQKSV